MFSNIKVGDYVLISKGFGSSNKTRKKVVNVKTRTFNCENDSYTYNISNGKAWGMSYRYACPYNELEWETHCKAKDIQDKRRNAVKVIQGLWECANIYSLEELEKVADLIKQINEEKQKATTISH